MKKIFSVLLLLTMIFTATSISFAEEDNEFMHVVMATDNNYVYPTVVAITSILENKKASTKLNFNILISGDLSYESKNEILSLETHYKNCKNRLIDMGDSFKNARTRMHITTAAFYRLRLPSILKNVDKCLYLDGDLVVNTDLTEIYNTDVTNCYIAGVKDFGAQSWGPAYAKLLEIKDMSQYVNTGVLVMNLKRIREDNLEEKFNKFIPNLTLRPGLHCHDQDVLNSVCYGKISHLPFKYNVMTHFNVVSEKAWMGKAKDCYTQDEWIEAVRKPQIIHYSGAKPWKQINVRLKEYWWDYAKKTNVWKKINELFTPNLAFKKYIKIKK